MLHAAFIPHVKLLAATDRTASSVGLWNEQRHIGPEAFTACSIAAKLFRDKPESNTSVKCQDKEGANKLDINVLQSPVGMRKM